MNTTLEVGSDVIVHIGEKHFTGKVTGFPKTDSVSVRYFIKERRKGGPAIIPGSGVFSRLNVELIDPNHKNNLPK